MACDVIVSKSLDAWHLKNAVSVVSRDDILRVEDCGLALSFVFTFTRLGSVKGKVHKKLFSFDGIYNARFKRSIKHLKSKKSSTFY